MQNEEFPPYNAHNDQIYRHFDHLDVNLLDGGGLACSPPQSPTTAANFHAATRSMWFRSKARNDRQQQPANHCTNFM
jgi:hypothetical protein